MNKKRTLITGIIAGLMIAMLSFAPAFAAQDLLKNGDFSEGNGQSSVKNWSVQAFAGSGTVKHVVSNDADAPYVTLTTNEESDFRLIQTIQAEPNTTYKFSGKIKTDGIKNKNNTGAILSVTYSQKFTDSLYDTKGKWKKVEMYIRTNTAKTYFDVSIGVGGHSSLNSGSASFKDLKLEVYKKKVPASATVCDMNEFTQPAQNNTSGSTSSSNSRWLIIVIILIVGSVIIYLLLSGDKKPEESADESAEVENAEGDADAEGEAKDADDKAAEE